ncbi:MAG: hypothetical protein HIU86_11580 [Acidobacteria bacterium]|nr:hypothetical protein [Acidobacteriota bacterium]
MDTGRLRRLTAAAAVLALAGVSAAPAALAPSHAAPASAAVVSRGATADRRFELTSTIDPTQPMHWLACRPIDYRIDPTDMPGGAIATVQHAMGVIAAQTGARFRYAGRTARTFDSTTHPSTPTIFIGFTDRTHDAGQTFGGPGGEIGVGGPAASWYSAGGRTVEGITFGRVLLSSRFKGPRAGAGVSWQALILHEVGHALDLAHRGGVTSIMHPELTASTPGRYTAAEVHALRQVLQTSGCDYGAWSRL